MSQQFNVGFNKGINKSIVVVISIVELVGTALIAILLKETLQFYDLAELTGIFLFLFEFYLKTFHFPHKKIQYLKEEGIKNITDAEIKLEVYKKPFNIIFLISLLCATIFGVTGIINDLGGGA